MNCYFLADHCVIIPLARSSSAGTVSDCPQDVLSIYRPHGIDGEQNMQRRKQRLVVEELRRLRTQYSTFVSNKNALYVYNKVNRSHRKVRCVMVTASRNRTSYYHFRDTHAEWSYFSRHLKGLSFRGLSVRYTSSPGRKQKKKNQVK